MTDTQKILEFDKIKETLADYACTDNAKEQSRQLKPYLSESDVAARLRETTQARTMIEKCGAPPATALKGIEEWITLASKGGCLTPEQLESIAQTMSAVRRMKDYLGRCKQFDIGLAYYDENLDALDEIQSSIHEKIRGKRVDDYASKHLKSVREAITHTSDKMSEKADSVMRANKAYVSDSFSTTRNGHICIPVKKEYKNKIGGSVIDKSSTGNTVFIEPSAVTKLGVKLQELRIDEENEERRILYTLSALLSDKIEIIRQNNRTIEKLDFIFAKAKLSLDLGGTLPRINTDRYIRLKNARHPLMEQSVNVPLDFELGGDVKGIVITGPNTGGKTVAVKTVALMCMMAQSGLHVPCEEAEICMNNAILCDIGDGQNISENLSTFSSHIKNVLDILGGVSKESLVVMDELGSGTDPAEGMGIAVAILEELKKSGALFLVTTHYPEIKEYARKEEGIVNARMTFDKESLRPLYQLVIGEAGESCAFYIAGKLGMPGYMLERASRAAYGEDSEISFAQAAHSQSLARKAQPKIQKKKKAVKQEAAREYRMGDSVMVLPDKKIGIVYRPADEKGMLRVQMPEGKIEVNYKRVRLHVPAEQLYPEDYDFSIVFDSVEKRKAQHDMARKYVEQELYCEE